MKPNQAVQITPFRPTIQVYPTPEVSECRRSLKIHLPSLIAHTNSFVNLKEEAQRTLDFAIMVAHAVPWLKHSMKDLDPSGNMPIRADYFDSRPVATAKVRESTKVYKESLARHVFFSSFSFFEAYVGSVLREIIEFHGREELISRTHLNEKTRECHSDVLKSKRKLQEFYTPKNKDRYKSHGKTLNSSGYRFPSTLLSTYGLKQLCSLIEDERVRAVEIPSLLQEALHIQLDLETEINVFHKYREARNRIAHGSAKPADFDIPNAISANDFLRNLALKIDRHVVDYFLIVETFE